MSKSQWQTEARYPTTVAYIKGMPNKHTPHNSFHSDLLQLKSKFDLDFKQHVLCIIVYQTHEIWADSAHLLVKEKIEGAPIVDAHYDPTAFPCLHFSNTI